MNALTLKVVEVHAGEGGTVAVNYLIADAEAPDVGVMLGTVPIYCQVADRVTADVFVTAVNGYPTLLAALEEARSHFKTEASPDGRILAVSHDSEALRKVVALLDAAIAKAGAA